MSFRFRRTERLKGRDEIRKVFSSGKNVSCSGMKLFYMENGLSLNRIAFTFGRKYGTAVERNRSRRLSREVYRHLKQNLYSGYDFVLLAYPGKDTFSQRTDQLRLLFSKAGLYMDIT
ncbi:ribonuclease P protein component [Treponema sp. OttesenSCG-928-L16]|nr:ribonuclease P protein component [Treponema sp. OttesenSCG-928-L16]